MQMKKHLFEKRIHAKDGTREEEPREGSSRFIYIFRLISNYRRYEGTRALPAAYKRVEQGAEGEEEEEGA